MSDIELRPVGARVTMDMIGSASAMRPVAWSERDTILYAIGVGAGLGRPESDLHFTTENSEGVVLESIPSFLTVLTASAQPPALATLDMGRFLHAEQAVELLHPLPPKGAGFVCNRVQSIEDKGANAIIHNVATLYADADGSSPMGHSRTSIFVRGGGGFGGSRPPSTSYETPAGAPDFSIRYDTRPEQALLYRLSGDRNPLHSDPIFARERDFPHPILHGLCTYGFACRALMAALADGHADHFAGMAARFTRPVTPGESLNVEIWRTTAGSASFRVLDESGAAVLERGTAHFRG